MGATATGTMILTPTTTSFGRWQKSGQWGQLLAAVSDDRYFEWLTTDASDVKAHWHGTGEVGGNYTMGRTKGG